MRQTISKYLIRIGILAIIAGLGLAAYNVYDSWRAKQASQKIIDEIPDIPEEDIPLYKQYPDMLMPAVEIDGYRYIAVLEIPSIHLKLPVMEEWDYKRLKIAPCRYSGSAYTRDMVIAGHNYRSHFSKIKWLDPGTEVILHDMAGNTFHYKIEWTEIIHPLDVSDMKDRIKEDPEDKKKTIDAGWDLTLFTCTTGGSTRFTARCVLTDEEY